MEQLIIFYPYPVIDKRGAKKMCKALLISEVIVNECLTKNYPLNTSKLQKILYFMQKEHLKKYNAPLFDEDVVAWECGPAMPEINEYFVAGRLGFEHEIEQSIILQDSHQEILDAVLDKYGVMLPSEVAEESKKELAWIKTWNNGLGKNKSIPLDFISPQIEQNIPSVEAHDE